MPANAAAVAAMIAQAGPWGVETPDSSCWERVILMDEAAEHVAASELSRLRNVELGSSGSGTARCQAPVRPLLVVVLHVGTQDPQQMPPPKHQHPVETFRTHGLHPPLGIGVGLRRPDRVRMARPVCRSAKTPCPTPSSCSSLLRFSARLKMADASLASLSGNSSADRDCPDAPGPQPRARRTPRPAANRPRRRPARTAAVASRLRSDRNLPPGSAPASRKRRSRASTARPTNRRRPRAAAVAAAAPPARRLACLWYQTPTCC